MIQDGGGPKEKTNIFWAVFAKKILNLGNEFDPVRETARIAGIYVVLGVLWILLSDRLLNRIVHDKGMLVLIGMVKGWIYVLITGGIIFGLVYAALRRIRNDGLKIIESYEELTAAYEELEAAHEEITASEEELRQQFDSMVEGQGRLADSEERYRLISEANNHMAYHDNLTGLPNRMALYEDLSKTLAQGADCRGALLFMDLDDFKFINDSMGHSFGDQLIRRIGERLNRLLKDVGTVYRLGGDEFIVYIKRHNGVEELNRYMQGILDGFRSPFEVGNSVLHTSLSIGTSLFPEHGASPDELLKRADIAMHKAKGEGKNKFTLFDQAMNEAVAERTAIEKHLRTALEKDEFRVHYQPQLDLKSGGIAGFEALLRWQNAELGAVSPIKFIKVAEDTHLIVDIGKWVLRNACGFIEKLHRNGHPGLTVSVNVSMLQLLQDDFVDEVMETLNGLSLAPEFLELEITESILMESFEMIGKKLTKLKQQGVRIALDDFGKGYSSLHYLLRLPITTLKVDKSFIDSIAYKTKERTLTGQIVAIGKSMGLCVVAEGVETQEQMDYLIEHECHKIQGFHFSRPVPEREAEDLLKKE